MGPLEGGAGARSKIDFGTSSTVGGLAGCTHIKRFGSIDPPRLGRPSIFGACERRLVVDAHPVPDGFSEEVLAIWQGEWCSDTLARTLGGCGRGGIVSK